MGNTLHLHSVRAQTWKPGRCSGPRCLRSLSHSSALGLRNEVWAEHPAALTAVRLYGPRCFRCSSQYWASLKNLVILAWCWVFLKAGFFQFRNKTKRTPFSTSPIPTDKKSGWSKSNYPCNDSWQHWQDRTMSTSPPLTPLAEDWQCPGWNLDPLLSNQITCLHLNMLSS